MEKLTISFTGTRSLNQDAARLVAEALAGLPPAERYVTGGCRGTDAFAGRWLLRHRPAAEHVVILPYQQAQVDPWWLLAGAGERVRLVPMPHGSSFKARNQRLVRLAGLVCGFPAYPEDDPRSLRSGTWQTLRMARAAGTSLWWQTVMPPYQGAGELALPAGMLRLAAE